MFMAAGVCISIEGLALISHLSFVIWHLSSIILVLDILGLDLFRAEDRPIPAIS